MTSRVTKRTNRAANTEQILEQPLGWFDDFLIADERVGTNEHSVSSIEVGA